MNTFIPEGTPDYGPFGITLANDPDSGALLVNSEPVEQFDDSISQEVEGLLFLGRLTHDCEILGHKFRLRTLTRGERLAVSLLVQEHENTLGLADALQTAYLACAIELVDGRPLSHSLEPEGSDQRLRRNYNIIQQWYDPVLEALWVEYQSLLVKTAQAFRELEGK